MGIRKQGNGPKPSRALQGPPKKPELPKFLPRSLRHVWCLTPLPHKQDVHPRILANDPPTHHGNLHHDSVGARKDLQDTHGTAAFGVLHDFHLLKPPGKNNRVRIYMWMFSDYIVVFLFFSPFFVRASKMSYFTTFCQEHDAFYTSPSTSPASFSTAPACPTNIPSITNKSWVTKSKK